MDLKEYLWRNQRTLSSLAEEVGVSENSLIHYKLRRRTPNLLLALKIVKATDSQVTLYELLSKKDADEFQKLVQT